MVNDQIRGLVIHSLFDCCLDDHSTCDSGSSIKFDILMLTLVIQTLLYWFVYRMDIEAFGPLNQLIASGCRGSVGDGTCHFDEFVRHISPKFRGSTNIGQDLNPDVDNAVQQLRSRGYKPEVKAHILFPSVFVDDGQPPSLAKIVEEVGDTIKACRSKLGDGKLGQNLYKARYAMDITQEARQADQAAGKIREIKQKIIALGKTFVRDIVTPCSFEVTCITSDCCRI